MQSNRKIFALITKQKYIRLNRGAWGSQRQTVFLQIKEYSIENVIIKRTKIKKCQPSLPCVTSRKERLRFCNRMYVYFGHVHIYT